MPIGVPRIIYCWGEELPAQWTDIYNFIFRRRMVFLMQYLDDELCNQICGLLINIHMEDRSKELEKKEMEKSGLFKGGSNKQQTAPRKNDIGGAPKMSSMNQTSAFSPKSVGFSQDLLTSEDDLAIDQNNMLEQYTLQKITMDWLNWNAQFFDYSDREAEPYLYYLADILSKDFAKDSGSSMYSGSDQSCSASAMRNQNISAAQLIKMFKNNSSVMNSNNSLLQQNGANTNSNGLDVYSPFRLLASFAAQNYSLNNVNPLMGAVTAQNSFANNQLKTIFNQFKTGTKQNYGLAKLLNELSQQKLQNSLLDNNTMIQSSEKALSQRNLKREYMQDRVNVLRAGSNNVGSNADFSNPSLNRGGNAKNIKPFNYLDFNSYGSQREEHNLDLSGSSAQLYRKQNERTMQEEESKKVFVIINSFGGSVGNGITVHDALQFIKAGSLTLGLGVAASAASLVLAGGTIGERYVTEGCHVMIHQPEGGLNGQASDIWIDANEIMKIRLDVAEIYSLSTYRPRHKILRDLDRDFYLTATETIQYGLADEIATNEVMHSIIELTNQAWNFDDSKQERLLSARDSALDPAQTQTNTGG
jgi:ATP-dependent Clp protease protease subunit